MINIVHMLRSADCRPNVEYDYGITDPKKQVIVRCRAWRDRLTVDRFYDILETDINLKNEYKPLSEAPDFLVNPMHVLNMAGIEVEVEGVGRKITDDVYWVVVDRNDLIKVDSSTEVKQ